MADEPNQFAALMERFAQGDEQAATELFEKYHKAITQVIRYRLQQTPQLRRQFDSTDFEQMVWHGIVALREKLSEFGSFKQLLNYLSGIVRHKIETARREYLEAEKRDLRRHRSLSEPAVAATVAAVADARPGPEQAASVHEAWDRWLSSLSRRQRQIVEMLRDGRTQKEIAADFGCSERSIGRIVADLRGTSPRLPLP